MVAYKLVPTSELSRNAELAKQFQNQLADYRRETASEMVAFPGSHLFYAEEGGKLKAWTLGHPAMAGKVFEGEKSFVPVAEYVAPESRGKVRLKPYYLGMVDAAKAQGFDFFHLRPDMPFMVTGKGEKIIKTRFDVLRKRGLKENEGFVGDTIMSFDADKVERILEERARQRAPAREARQPANKPLQQRQSWLAGFFQRMRQPKRHVK